MAELLAEGERMPVYVHVIDHPDVRVLVETGMTELALKRAWPTEGDRAGDWPVSLASL